MYILLRLFKEIVNFEQHKVARRKNKFGDLIFISTFELPQFNFMSEKNILKSVSLHTISCGKLIMSQSYQGLTLFFLSKYHNK